MAVKKRVEQRKWDKGDCGIACVAMVVEEEYETIERVFYQHGLVDKKGNFYTRHHHLANVIKELGRMTKRKKFKSWEQVETPAIVKINVREGNFWHWVVLDEVEGEKVMYDPEPHLLDQIRSFEGKRGCGQYLQVIR